MFPAAGNTAIHDSHFASATNIKQTFNHYHLSNPSDSNNSLAILEANIAIDALFDSDARFDPPKCHPQTRTAVLDHIRRWSSENESTPVLWIRGAAGAGKSAIAQTLSEGWDEEGILAATFYFSRTASGRNEKKHLIPTLAYQLSIVIPETRPYLENTLRMDPRVFKRNLRTQMKRLIIDPLLSVFGNTSVAANVVVIDGLDECCVDYPNQDHEQQQKEILECILSAVTHDGFPLRFLIASRPERQIREILEHGSLNEISSRIVLDGTQNPAKDIELYLRYKFKEIRRVHAHLGPSWPTEDIITQLVTKSSGHFIYAAVVIRYLSSPRMNPEVGLKALLGTNPVQSGKSPFAELDAVYTLILQSVASESLPTIMNIFMLMIHKNIASDSPASSLFDSSITAMSPLFIAKYLFLSLGDINLHLTDLHSLLDIPSAEALSALPIAFLHASFSEFLSEPSRSGTFYIDEAKSQRFLLGLSIRHLFVQVLSPTESDVDGYQEEGFGWQTGCALREIEPDSSVLEALKALLDRDETVLVQYLTQNDLTGLGTTRRSMVPIGNMYRAIQKQNEKDIPVVFVVLKEHGIGGFVPIDPADFYPTVYGGALDWFCDTHPNETATSASATNYCLSENSETLDKNLDNQKLERMDDLSSNPGNLEETSSPVRDWMNNDLSVGEQSPKIFSHEEQCRQEALFERPVTPRGDADKSSPSHMCPPSSAPISFPFEGRPPPSIQEGKSSPTLELEETPLSPPERSGNEHIISRWQTGGIHPDPKQVPPTFLRQIAGLGLRPGSPIYLSSMRRSGRSKLDKDNQPQETGMEFSTS